MAPQEVRLASEKSLILNTLKERVNLNLVSSLGYPRYWFLLNLGPLSFRCF